jgi:hypothetical protein
LFPRVRQLPLQHWLVASLGFGLALANAVRVGMLVVVAGALVLAVCVMLRSRPACWSRTPARALERGSSSRGR